jgi:hypothetical protein
VFAPMPKWVFEEFPQNLGIGNSQMFRNGL